MSAIPPDLQLLQQFSVEGDEAAFAQIVQRYAGLVYAAGYRVLADRARAEEVAQETFLRLARRPYAVSRSLGGWLHRSATQLAIDVHRSEKARRQREVAFADEAMRQRMNDAAHAEPREAASWAEVSPLVDAAMNELPEEARQLLVEHFLEGRTQQAIAHERRVSPATICRQIKAAVELLGDKLRGRGVLAAPAILAMWLGEQAGQAAPVTLLHELGKMSMVSPVVRCFPPPVGPPPAEPTRWTTVRRTAALVAQVMLLLAMVAFLMWPIVRKVRLEVHPPAPIAEQELPP